MSVFLIKKSDDEGESFETIVSNKYIFALYDNTNKFKSFMKTILKRLINN